MKSLIGVFVPVKGAGWFWVQAEEDSFEDPEKSKGEEKSGGNKKEDKSDNSIVDKKKESKDGKDDGKDEKEKKPPIYKKPAFIITVAIILLVIVVGLVLVWLYVRHFVWTDDAYIDGNVVQVAPQVAASVIALHTDDNMLVHKGDLLIELDPTIYKVELQQAEAQLATAQGRLAQARAQVESARTEVAQADAQIEAATAQLDNANNDLHRYQEVDAAARTRQQLDNAATAQKSSHAQLHGAQARKASSEAGIQTALASVTAAEGDVQTAQANIKHAQVSLGYCQIYAPCDGRVTQRTVEVGNYVAVGDAMFLLVSPTVWITANFKETQLTRMRPGQEVVAKVDAYPNVRLHGKVDSIQAGSGSRFSVLPAENATGNFVKIVQRVPVKIVFDAGPNTNDTGLLSPGMSVVPRVRVR